jgi:hypothetical protein
MRSTRSVAGRSWSLESWIPAEDLADLSENIVGLIDVVAEYRRDASAELGRARCRGWLTGAAGCVSRMTVSGWPCLVGGSGVCPEVAPVVPFHEALAVDDHAAPTGLSGAGDDQHARPTACRLRCGGARGERRRASPGGTSGRANRLHQSGTGPREHPPPRGSSSPSAPPPWVLTAETMVP